MHDTNLQNIIFVSIIKQLIKKINIDNSPILLSLTSDFAILQPQMALPSVFGLPSKRHIKSQLEPGTI